MGKGVVRRCGIHRGILLPCDSIRVRPHRQRDRGILRDVRKRHILHAVGQILIHTGFAGLDLHARRLRSSCHGNKPLAIDTGYRVVGSGLGDIGDLTTGNRDRFGNASVPLVGVVHPILIPIERSIDFDRLVCTHLVKRRKTIITAIGHGGLRHAAPDGAPVVHNGVVVLAAAIAGIFPLSELGFAVLIALADSTLRRGCLVDDYLCAGIRCQPALAVSALHNRAAQLQCAAHFQLGVRRGGHDLTGLLDRRVIQARAVLIVGIASIIALQRVEVEVRGLAHHHCGTLFNGHGSAWQELQIVICLQRGALFHRDAHAVVDSQWIVRRVDL